MNQAITINPLTSKYRKRPVRFLELHQLEDWVIKIYSISTKSETVDAQFVELAKQQLGKWLNLSKLTDLKTHKMATLILHEGKEGCFAIINWWIDENMLQQFVYLSSYEQPFEFQLYSSNGIMTCVWELAVIWFERNNWIENVLMKPDSPDINTYINLHLNDDV